MRTSSRVIGLACVLAAALPLSAMAQAARTSPATTPARMADTSAPSMAPGIVPPAGYVIGPDDVLSVVFWRDKDMSIDVNVRPDGRITLPLLNDVQAAGLTPPQLRDKLTDAAKEYLEDPNVTVIVRQINSRRVFVTGEVTKPGPYPLTGPTTVLQMIATAGGLKEYAEQKKISVIRNENGRTTIFPFNYKDVSRSRNLKQNIELKPGDTIVVPES